MRTARTVNFAATLRSEYNVAWFILGLLLSILGAIGYTNAPSFNAMAAPAIPGALMLLAQARRFGIWR